MPPIQGGGDMIQTVSFEKTTFQAPPLRFEAGTPMIAEVIGLGAALTYVKAHKNFSYEKRLIDFTIENLKKIEGIKILGPLEKISLITFTIEGVHPLDAATLLDLKGIALRSGHLCAQPLLKHFGLTAALRLSIAPYNTQEEIAQLCTALKEISHVLNPV